MLSITSADDSRSKQVRKLRRSLRRAVGKLRFIEALEQRVLLATVAWDGGGDGTSWNDPLNWGGDALPGPTDDAVIQVDGALASVQITSNVTVNTINSTEDVSVQGATLTVGTLAVDSLSVGAGSVLTAPQGITVSVTAAEDVSVDAASTISADGMGYGSGAGPGAGQSDWNAGSGGGYGGAGGASYNRAGGGSYGSTTEPVDLGSGGGGAIGQGGAGGGAMRLTVGGTLSLEGSITANGLPGGVGWSNYGGGGGSGGSIYLATGTLTGGGAIMANGGAGYDASSGGGGGGRVAVYYGSSSLTGTMTARGGSGNQAGGAGTVLTRSSSQAGGQITVDNGGNQGAVTPLIWAGPFDGLTVANGGVAYIQTAMKVGTLDVKSGGQLSHDAGQKEFDLTVTGDAMVEKGGTISADGMGYGSGAGPGAGQSDWNAGSGGGYGGAGGASYNRAGGGSYGSTTEPVDLGSGGGGAIGQGGAGGGAMRLTVGGTLSLEGSITANGLPGGVGWSNYGGGGGSGGSIYLTAGTLTGGGAIMANGGAGYDASSGGGGGGRVAVYYGSSTFTGTMMAYGGNGYQRGGAGAIFTKSSSQSWGDLLIDNGAALGAVTPLSSPATLDNLDIANGAMAYLQAAMTVGKLTVKAGGMLSHDAGQKEFDLTVTGDATVASGGAISADGKGYGSRSGPGAGQFFSRGSGGGYGGVGGASYSRPGGVSYGSTTEPVDLGSGGGGGSSTGGAGGGAMRLTVGGTLTVEGSITANGLPGGVVGYGDDPGGGGSGGSIYLTAGTLTGGGAIMANGGAGYDASSGGGGGGRIAIDYLDKSAFTGTIQVNGGTGYQNGRDGTIFLYHNLPLHVLRQTPAGILNTLTSHGAAVDHVDIEFDKPIDPATFTSDDVVLTGTDGLPMAISGQPEFLGGTLWRIHFPAQSRDGTYGLKIGPGITSVSGHKMDQDFDYAEAAVDADAYHGGFTIDWTPPAVAAAVPGGDSSGRLTRIDLMFSEPVVASTVTAAALTVTDPASNPIAPSGITQLNSTWFRISLPAQAMAGIYSITVKSSVTDLAGNPMDATRNSATVKSRMKEVWDTQATTLTLGQATQAEFTTFDQWVPFKLDLQSRGNFRLTLDDADDLGSNEMYVGLNQPPTPGQYDYRYPSAGADQQILIPGAPAGRWYVLVIGGSVGAYTVRAETMPDVVLTSVSPSSVGNAGTATLIIDGAGFDSSTKLSLVGNGQTYVPTQLSVVSGTKLMADFDAPHIPAGDYQLQASGATPTLPFHVQEGGQAYLEAHLTLPSWLGYHAPATIYIEYSNMGNVAMPAPLLVLTPTQNGRAAALLTLDGSRQTQGFWTSAIPEGFSNSVQFLASGQTPGLLQPGESRTIPVYYAGWQQPWDGSYPPVYFNLGALTAPGTLLWPPEQIIGPVGLPSPAHSVAPASAGATPAAGTTPVDWPSLKDGMRPDYVQPDAWDAIWANFTSEAGGTWEDYLAMLDENAVYLDRIGEPTSDVSRLLSFEFRQADALNPIRYLAQATDASMSAPGMDLVFSRAYAQPISRRYEIGPLGRGWADNWQLSFVRKNDGTVVITDMTGTPRIFQPDSRYSGQYLAQPNDHGKLVAGPGGSLILTESDGTAYAFRSDGNLDFVQDTNGNRITCAYTAGLLTSLTQSNGESLTIAYNLAGRIQSVTDSDGRQTLFTYDASNEHLISVRGYDGRVTSYTYVSGQGAASEHALSQITFAAGTHRYFMYDAEGRLASTSRDGGAEAIHFNYDLEGTVTAMDALGNPSQFFFDDWGQIVKATNALGNSVTLALDDQRNLKSVTDPAGRSWLYSYDANGNLVRSVDAMGNITNFTYTPTYNELSSITDANGKQTRYTYDAHGNLASIIYANGTIESWTYDATGDPTQWTNRRADAVGFSYNSDAQLTRKTYADGTYVDYVYDTRGNLRQTQDASGTTTYTYDPNDYLTRIDYPGGQWLVFTYDAGGRRATSLDQTGHQLNYFYDPVGRLSYMTDETGTRIVQYTYDAAGRLIRKDLGNGIYTTYTYDGAGQLLDLTNYAPGGGVLSYFNYTYESRGRRITEATNYGTWTYAYDDLGQLTHAVLASIDADIPNQDLTYVYDALGNRIQTIENGVTTNYTVNNMNQYTQVGDTTYTFDADGNLIQETSPSGTTTYSYDDENRLIAVHKGADAWRYTYDAFGQRVANSQNGTTTHYVIDPIGLGNVVGEYDGSGNLISYDDYGFGLLSRTDAAGASACYTFDAIGNTITLIGAAGRIVNSYAYAPFGAVLDQTVTEPNPFQFVGEYGVTAGGNALSCMRARYYEPLGGRFTSSDPIGLRGGLNLYAYVRNDPTGRSDPEGLQCGPVATWRWEMEKLLITLGCHGVPVGEAISVGEMVPNIVYIGDKSHWMGDFNNNFWNTTYAPGFGPQPGRTPVETNPYCALSEQPAPAPNPSTQPVGSGKAPAVGMGDPNAKIGPSGLGAQSFVADAGIFPYRIDFENDPSATAPAQQVIVSDQLNGNLDWSSFELTEIGFGDYSITIPAHSQHMQTTVPMSYHGVNFEVQVEAGIYSATGEAYAIFRSIDPATGLPPTVDIGFLPPEDETGRGQGHISYTVKPKLNLPTGTQIRNVAVVTFDFAEYIATNQIDPHDPSKGTDPAKECLNTIDSGAPGSRVLPLFPVIWDDQFRVSWAGEDDAGGSGVGSYDIYVSDDGGPYTLWLSHTTVTSADFAGQPKHAYAFYSVARDNVGNVESAPTDHDAITYVEGALRGTAGDDVIRIVQDGDQPGNVLVFINNDGSQPSYGASLTSLEKAVILGGGGDDVLIVDFSNGNPVPAGGISFDGGEGSDTVILKDDGGSSALSVSTNAVSLGGAQINLGGVEGVGVALGGTAAVSLNESAALASLSLAGTASLSLAKGGDKVLRLNSLTITDNGTLDLADNDLIVQANTASRQDVLAQITGCIKTARNTGSKKWLGFGVTSSAAKDDRRDMTTLAPVLNEKGSGGGMLYSKFAGQDVDGNCILVKYTWNGDLNIDGVVNADDYFLIDSGFITQKGGYYNGDLNFDGKVTAGVINADDYFLIDSAYIGQTGPLPASRPEAINIAPATAEAIVMQRQQRKDDRPGTVLAQLFSVVPVL